MKCLVLSLVWLVLFQLFSGSASARVSRSSKPNIILVMADDQGYGDLSCYGAKFNTPNIDALASEGMRFTDYYAPANVCTPSRAGLLTGCYPERIGINKVFFPAQGPEYARGKDTLGLNLNEQTIAELLRDNGYATACVGKWHLGDKKIFLPLQHGFDEFYGIPYSHDMYPGNNAAYASLPLYKNNKVVQEGPATEQLTQLFTDFSVDFINRNRHEPFFLYLAYSMPHVPLAVSAKYKGATNAGLYADVIHEMDMSVGRIRAALKKNNIDDNTIVIFTSDNGPWTRFGNHAGSAAPLREGKGTTFEGGHRVPFIIKWKKNIPAGIVSGQPVSGVDVLPTLMALTGSQNPDRKIDGHDFSAFLKNPSQSMPGRPVYFYSGSRLNAIRAGRYKYHFGYQYDSLVSAGNNGKQGQSVVTMQPEALYDLQLDPSESDNIIEKQEAVAQELKAMAIKHIEDVKKYSRPVGTVNQPGTVSVDRKLIWQDEFDGDNIDQAKWNIVHAKRRKDPDGRDAWWSKNNCYLNKGNLVIRTSGSDSAYAGGCINTEGKFERRFGYYETKIKLQTQEGHWGAFWLFAPSVNHVGNEGRDGTEIDIFESVWVGKGMDKVQSALHYDGYNEHHKKSNQRVEGMYMNDGGWHIFGCEWTDKYYRFYYDDKLVWETNFGGVSQVPQHIILSDEIGLWDGTYDIRKAKLPDYMIVDYVRVYDKR